MTFPFDSALSEPPREQAHPGKPLAFAGRIYLRASIQRGVSVHLTEESSNLALGGVLSIATAFLLATQAPFSALAAKHLSLPTFIGVTAITLLCCVPLMLLTAKARQDFTSIVSTKSNFGKLAILLVIGLLAQAIFALGLGKGDPVAIAAILNLDPFWAAVVAYLIVKKKIPTSTLTFCACLVIAFAGALTIAISQSGEGSLSHLSLSSFLGAGIAFPIPILTSLSGTLVGKWFSKFDEAATLAVTFMTSAAVVIPLTSLIAYLQSGIRIDGSTLAAAALLAFGTVLSAAVGRVIYQKALSVTDNNNGFVSMFFLLIPGFTALLSLALSPWIKEVRFMANPIFFIGLLTVAAPILLFSWRSWRAAQSENRAR